MVSRKAIILAGVIVLAVLVGGWVAYDAIERSRQDERDTELRTKLRTLGWQNIGVGHLSCHGGKDDLLVALLDSGDGYRSTFPTSKVVEYKWFRWNVRILPRSR